MDTPAINLAFSSGPLISAAVTTRGAAFEAAIPKDVILMPANNSPHSGGVYHTYAVSADAQRILIARWIAGGAAATAPSATTPVVRGDLTVAMHWASALKK